jgi:CheY-like chemotaxis protein
MLGLVLKKRHVVCDMAADGYEAIEIIKADPEKQDIILMDYTMPGMVRKKLATI